MDKKPKSKKSIFTVRLVDTGNGDEEILVDNRTGVRGMFIPFKNVGQMVDAGARDALIAKAKAMRHAKKKTKRETVIQKSIAKHCSANSTPWKEAGAILPLVNRDLQAANIKRPIAQLALKKRIEQFRS